MNRWKSQEELIAVVAAAKEAEARRLREHPVVVAIADALEATIDDMMRCPQWLAWFHAETWRQWIKATGDRRPRVTQIAAAVAAVLRKRRSN